MPNGFVQDNADDSLGKEALDIMAAAITHPLGFWVMILGFVVLMAAYGALVKNPFWLTRKKLVDEIADAVAERLK